MIDLFGLSRSEQDPPQEETPNTPKQAVGESAGSHRLWAFLLVLDSIFVVVFGGAVATIVYKHWQEPVAVVTAVPHRRPAPKTETPKPAEPAPAPAAPAPKAPEPAKAAEAAKPAPKPAQIRTSRAADTPRPPKPSLLTDGPRPHATPALAAASAPAAAAPASAPSAPGKAQPVIFKLHAPRAANVQLVGAFIVHGGRKEMTKGHDGTWSVKLYLNPGQYRYFFAVDKKKMLDPENPNSDRGASLLSIP